MTETAQSHRVPGCGQRAYLPRPLVDRALSFAAPGGAEEEDVERKLRCPLAAHDTGDHHALVLQLDGPGARAVWTTWAEDEAPQQVEVRDDCCAVSPDKQGRACCEFADHPGAHTFDVDDLAYAEHP